MQLTTLARVKTWAPLSASSTQHDGLIRGQISAVSAKLESFLRRHVLIQARTEDLFVESQATRFLLRGAPIYTTTAIAQRDGYDATVVVGSAPTLTYSPLREFTETSEDTSFYYLRNAEGVVEFDFPFNYTDARNPGALRASYTAGLAYTLDQLACSSTSSAGSLQVGDAVTGSSSGAVGTVLAHTPNTSITVRVLSGLFEVGERFAKTSDAAIYATFTAWGATGAPLCMAYPEIVEACNMQVAWWFMRREQLGVTNVSIDGASISTEKSGTLLKGVQETLEHLVRYGASY